MRNEDIKNSEKYVYGHPRRHSAEVVNVTEGEQQRPSGGPFAKYISLGAEGRTPEWWLGARNDFLGDKSPGPVAVGRLDR